MKYRSLFSGRQFHFEHRYVILTNKRNNLPVGTFPLGLAPRIAKLTLAFLPSIIGFGSLQALSADCRSPIITFEEKHVQL